jgi:hypothetical protein
MLRFCEAGPYDRSHHEQIVTIGGGITTDNLLYALHMYCFGGVFIHPDITARQLPAGEGPARLVVVKRYHFSSSGAGRAPNSARIPTLGEVLEHIGSKFASWETALRAFLTKPRVWLHEPQPLLLWLDAQSKEEEVDAIYVKADVGDPMLHVWKLKRSNTFPDVMFFSERPLNMESTGNPFGP